MVKKRRTELDIDPELTLAPEPEPEPEVVATSPKPESSATKETSDRKVNKTKLAIITGVVLAFVVISVAGGWSLYQHFADKGPEPKQPEEKIIIPDGATLYQFKPFLINLGENEKAFIVNISFAADMSKAEVGKEIDNNLVLIRENIFQILQGKSAKAFLDERNRRRMAAEITTALNRLIQSGSIKKMFITEMTIQ
ncbi:hypothetical protein MNBD_NITROSPINAE04-2608 [hydrothermal vent metagenome]|uniref:Flagellar protein FliL n=1 Tax=hydrothermal vent metagenome TaxID=652676 RepID=A0A3B1C004_9ZZZZ